jgi:hypothetical protein
LPQKALNIRAIYYMWMTTGAGKLGEYSDKFGSIIGNQAEYSDKSANTMADAAPRAEASLQLMEVGIASYTMKNVVLPGIRLALEICPNFHPTVFWMKIRTRGPQPSICVRIFTQFTRCMFCRWRDRQQAGSPVRIPLFTPAGTGLKAPAWQLSLKLLAGPAR